MKQKMSDEQKTWRQEARYHGLRAALAIPAATSFELEARAWQLLSNKIAGESLNLQDRVDYWHGRADEAAELAYTQARKAAHCALRSQLFGMWTTHEGSSVVIE